MELGYARVSTTTQDLDQQIDALAAAGVDPGRIYVDRTTGAGTHHLTELLGCARAGDVLVVRTLDRLGRNVRDTLNLIRDLCERGVGLRSLADPVRVDSSDPDDSTAQLAVELLALIAQMDRTYALERAAHARAVATTKHRRIGRPSVVTESQIAHAVQLRDAGATIAEITAKTGLTRSTLYRHLPPRPSEQLTFDLPEPAPSAPTAVEPAAPAVPAGAETAVVPTPAGADRLTCPTCRYRPSARRDAVPHLSDLATVWLHLDVSGRVNEHRHCVRCQPHDDVTAIICVRCGDGPLLAGGGAGGGIPAAVTEWLTHRGWRTTPELVCESHG